MNKKTVKEPFVRIVKRPYADLKVTVIANAAAVVLALLLSLLLLMAVSGLGPDKVLGAFFSASVSTGNRLLAFLQDAALLLLIAIGLAPAFKMHFWNIGAQGQILMGGLMTAICMYYIKDAVPAAVLIPVMLISALLISGVWCLIPAFFKVRFGANETLFTLMLNYVAIQIVMCFTDTWKGTKSAFGVIDRFTGSANGYLGRLFGIDIGWTLLISMLLTVLMFIYLSRTKHGYEIAVVGESLNTARYAGINDRKVILRTAFISGAICGLAGFLYVSNVSHTISAATGGNFGFTAIIVAWLGAFNPAVMTVISLLLTFVSKGAGDVRNLAGLDSSICDVVVCIFLFFILGCTFFTRYQLVFRHKADKEGGSELKAKEAGV
ncbi:MAG: ABC transporter permease [Lachnospiraceae bacterium]|nr:ABC transporter permease [Lachnospiraceae bacterium]